MGLIYHASKKSRKLFNFKRIITFCSQYLLVKECLLIKDEITMFLYLTNSANEEFSHTYWLTSNSGNIKYVRAHCVKPQQADINILHCLFILLEGISSHNVRWLNNKSPFTFLSCTDVSLQFWFCKSDALTQLFCFCHPLESVEALVTPYFVFGHAWQVRWQGNGFRSNPRLHFHQGALITEALGLESITGW